LGDGANHQGLLHFSANLLTIFEAHRQDMKKTTLLILCVTVNSFKLLSQVPNGSFENWTNFGAYENPDGWSTLNHTTAQSGIFTVTKGTPGNPGNAYLKVTSKTTGTSVTGGLAVSGKLDTVNKIPLSGFSFTQAPVSFGGRWQHMIFGSSQGSVKVLLTKWNSQLNQRNVVATASVVLTGMAMSWANFSLNFNYTDSIYPDSCMIVLNASGSNPTNLDYLWVDNLAFSGTVSMPPPIDPVGIDEKNSKPSELSVFPVPAKENITLILATGVALQKVEIRDLFGKLILQMDASELRFENNTTRLEVNALSEGCYELICTTSSAVTRRKILIE
jgi:hypothetical protein